MQISCKIRNAIPTDVKDITQMITELAIYQDSLDELLVSEALMEKNLFCEQPRIYCLIGEVDGKIAGFALFFYNFSTWHGRDGLYLEDLFVRSEYRSTGLGFKLIHSLAKVAKENDCARMEWSVQKANELALNFYNRLGATPKNDWVVYRFSEENIANIAKSKG